MATTKEILRTYLRRLTNLSGNNRSLLLLRLAAEQLIDLHELSHLNGEPSFQIINALIAGKNKKLCQVLDSRVESNNEASKKIKNLQRVDRFLFEERGSNDLHVGWPFVEGKLSDGTLVRCPLLFFPVSILQTGAHWYLEPREEAGITFNKSFLLAYAHYNQVKIEESLFDFAFDDFDTDSTMFRTQLYQLIKDKIELNFNPDNFRDELVSFQLYKKDEFDEQHRNGEIKLFPQAVLGIFPQAGSQLVPDYLHILEQDDIEDIESIFLPKAPIAETESITALSEEKLLTPFVIDAYQENAIRAVKSGKSIVVQGPPGTGKSQLICNLMADAMASGKRALLVCQKRAALDVVYDRLQSLDVSDFLGLVHDFRNDRKEIFTKIASQIERLEEYQARNRSLDVIQTERKFTQVCRRIDALTEELNDFKTALFNEHECGITPKELYLTSDPHATVINLKQEYQYFPYTNWSNFQRTLRTYSLYAASFESDTYCWKQRKSFASLEVSEHKDIEAVVREIPQVQNKISAEIFRLIGVTLDLESAESFLNREEEAQGMLSILKDETSYRYFQSMVKESDDETSLLWLANMERVCLNCFEGEGPESTVTTDQLGNIQLALYERAQWRKNIFKRLYWELFSDHKFLIKRTLVANSLPYSNDGLKTLELRLDNRLNLEHQLTAIKAKLWLKDLPEGYDKKALLQWFNTQKLAIRAKLVFNTLRELKAGIPVENVPHAEFISLIKELLAQIKPLTNYKAAWLKYLTPFQFRQLYQTPTLVDEWLTTLRHDFDNLCAFDKLKESLQPYEQSIIGRLNQTLNHWQPEAIQSLFNNSVRIAWIEHLETKYPVLRMVSLFRMEEVELELQQLVEEKQKISEEILRIKVRELAYENIEYNRLNNRITYRDLYHQVTKKKKIWPVRKVIETFHEELFKLVPCWMASPESVSAIFPMQSWFDVVIFDEASQCFSERGLPAMCRGKQLVIAGDGQQLKPNELYQVRWQEDGDSPELEVDSLLELSERFIETVHLQGHYRSQSLELIDFSNRHFYEGKLRLLPDREILNQHQPAIEFVKVEGTWINNTNPFEAAAVVERILQFLNETPNKSLGVVTFNAPQQLLILDLLEDAAQQKNMRIPSTLFVKNIENVQGDEKDTILFSVGYAPDENGKMAMMFGSLNAMGGENRLNVAVTRAREKIILISSIWPEQLKTDGLKNDGPVLLKKYLEYARDVHDKRFEPAVNYQLKEDNDWYLNSRLKTWSEQLNLSVVFETNSLPYADVSIKKASEYKGIILTDDARYYQSLSAKDAHAYTPALLKARNWHYRSIYSRHYWKDKEKVETELKGIV